MVKATSDHTSTINDLYDEISLTLCRGAATLLVLSTSSNYCEEKMGEAIGFVALDLFEARKTLDALLEQVRS
jgi:hypothetical protein